MSLRSLFFLVALCDVVMWGAWYVLLTMTSPESGLMIIMLFYASLLVSLTGLFALIGLGLRFMIHRDHEAYEVFVMRTFRQAFFLAVLIIISLWLAHNEWLRWWVLALVIGTVATWEHFFLSGEEV